MIRNNLHDTVAFFLGTEEVKGFGRSPSLGACALVRRYAGAGKPVRYGYWGRDAVRFEVVSATTGISDVVGAGAMFVDHSTARLKPSGGSASLADDRTMCVSSYALDYAATWLGRVDLRIEHGLDGSLTARLTSLAPSSGMVILEGDADLDTDDAATRLGELIRRGQANLIDIAASATVGKVIGGFGQLVRLVNAGDVADLIGVMRAVIGGAPGAERRLSPRVPGESGWLSF
ncbi:MAG: hypothetical protein RJQ08_11765 [Salinisphaeraceae bacterium]